MKLTVGQYSFEVEGTEQFVKDEMAAFKKEFLEQVELPPATPDAKQEPRPSDDDKGKGLHIKDFVRGKKAGSDQERAAIVAYYLQKYKGISEIDGPTFSEWCTKAGWKPPQVPGQTLIDAKNKKRYFDAAKEKGKFILNDTGTYFVDEEWGKSSDA